MIQRIGGSPSENVFGTAGDPVRGVVGGAHGRAAAVLAAAFLSVAVSTAGAGTTFTSVSDGNWNTAGTWDQGAGYPKAANDDVAEIWHDIILNVSDYGSTLNINAGGKLTVQAHNSGNPLTFNLSGGTLEIDVAGSNTLNFASGSVLNAAAGTTSVFDAGAGPYNSSRTLNGLALEGTGTITTLYQGAGTVPIFTFNTTSTSWDGQWDIAQGQTHIQINGDFAADNVVRNVHVRDTGVLQIPGGLNTDPAFVFQGRVTGVSGDNGGTIERQGNYRGWNIGSTATVSPGGMAINGEFPHEAATLKFVDTHANKHPLVFDAGSTLRLDITGPTANDSDRFEVVSKSTSTQTRSILEVQDGANLQIVLFTPTQDLTQTWTVAVAEWVDGEFTPEFIDEFGNTIVADANATNGWTALEVIYEHNGINSGSWPPPDRELDFIKVTGTYIAPLSVPEPASLALLGLGAALMVVRRKIA